MLLSELFKLCNAKSFDEKDCRVTRGLLNRDWAEFMVIWRKNRLELYEDYVRTEHPRCQHVNEANPACRVYRARNEFWDINT